MKSRQSALSVVFAALLGTLVVSPAHALLITTTAIGFDNSASVTDSEGGASASNNGASLGISSISQFDASTGVLTGAILNLISTQTQTTYVTSTDGPNNGNNNSVTSSGTGSSSIHISAPGVSNTFSTNTLTDACTGNRQESCVGSASTSSASADLAGNVSSGSLNSYVGAGNVTVTRTAPTLTASQTDNKFTGTESTLSTVTWEGSVSATYEYLLHAFATFDGASQLILDLDFGTYYLGEAAPDMSFSIYNSAGERAGLDLNSILGSGDDGILTTNLAVLLSLDAGSGENFLASFDTSSLGDFSASYSLGLSDDAQIGAASSRYSDYALMLNLKGKVIERQIAQVASVPEPSGLALLGLGLAGLAISRRKRNRSPAILNS